MLYVVAPCLEMPEAATRDVLQEGVSLEILQNSQENTYARVSFLIKLQASRFFRTLRGDCFTNVLEGVYTWNFIPGWNSSPDEIIPVYGKMSLTVYTFFPRWNFIPRWKTGLRFDPGMKKRHVNTSSRDEILKWACF